uniref:GRIP domain-containing protein n=1 Tax=Dunaliella tertiolecta TaxID=3047 RepID=A0A7S3R0Y0_DUNTE
MAAMAASHQQQLEKMDADTAALQAEHTSSLDAMRAALAEAESIAQEARAAASDAQRRFDAAGFEVQALREQCAGMEASANERVERLQKVNKKRNAEVDDLRAQLASLSSRLATSEASAQKQASAAEAQVADLEERNRVLAREAAELGGQLAMAEQNCHRMNEKASQARQLGEEKAAVQSFVDGLRAKVAELEQQAAEVVEMRKRVQSAEAVRDAATEEAMRATSMLNNLEARLSEIEEDNERLSAALDETRLRSAFSTNPSTAATKEGDNSSGAAAAAATQPQPSFDLPPDGQWPPWLQAKFQAEVERAVTSKGQSKGLGRDSGTGDKEQEGSSTKGAEAAVAAEVRAEALNAALAKTEAELQNVTERAAEMEQTLRDEMVTMAAAHADELKEAVAGALANAEEAETALHQARQEVAGLKKQVSALQEELQHVRNRSRALLEERERQVEELRRAQRAPSKAPPAAAHAAHTATADPAIAPTMGGAPASATASAAAAPAQLSGNSNTSSNGPNGVHAAVSAPAKPGVVSGAAGVGGGVAGNEPPSRAMSGSEIEPAGDAGSDAGSVASSSRGGPPGSRITHHSRTNSEMAAARGAAQHQQWPISLQAVLDSVGMLASRYGSSQQDIAKLQQLQQQVQSFRAAYEDSERTHALRTQSEAALKAELHQLRALGSIADPDVSYLRRVLVDAFTSGALPRSSPIFPVIARLLKLTTAELHSIKASNAKVQRDPAAAQPQLEGSVLSQLASIWGKG